MNPAATLRSTTEIRSRAHHLLARAPDGGTAGLDLGAANESYSVRWYDPRNGGPLQSGTVAAVTGPGVVALGQPPGAPGDDWVILVRRRAGDRE